jgi:Tol biopolymer transport system component
MTVTRRLLRLPAALAITAGLILSQAGAAHATFARRDGRIAFSDFMTGQIYAVNPDGTGLAQLTRVAKGQAAADPAWSPDGRHIAFDSTISGPPRLWIMDADGHHLRMVARDRPNVADLLPTYTPDGRHLVFSRCITQPDHCALYSIRVDGSHLRALTRFGVFSDFFASVSPGGRHIAFTRFGAKGIVSQVYVMRADGSGAHAVTPPVLEGFAPHWSPTGKLITFTSNSGRAGSNIYVMHPDGTGIRRLTRTPFLHNSFLSAYAPQGDRIVFASDRRYPNFCCSDLFVMRSNGTRQTLVHTGLTGVVSPSWGTAPLAKAVSGASAISRLASPAVLRRADGRWCRALPAVLRLLEKCAGEATRLR